MTRLLSKISNWYFSKRALPYWCVLAMDSLFVAFSCLVGFVVEKGWTYVAGNILPVTWGILFSVLVFIISFRIFHTYSGFVRYSSFVDFRRIVNATLSAALVTLALGLVLNGHTGGKVLLPGVLCSVVVFVLTTFLMFVVRLAVKSLFEMFGESEDMTKVFIYGIREGGVGLAKYIQNQIPKKYSLAGFVSTDQDRDTEYLMGVKVYREGPDAVEKMKEASAKAILVSPLKVEKFRRNDAFIDALVENGIKIMMMSQPEEWDGKGESGVERLKEVDIEDLLPREEIKIDMDAIGALLHGKRVLVTGAAGSIGSEIVRQVASFGPDEMVLIDQAETPMHDIRLMMAREFPAVKAETVVSTITDKSHMEMLFSRHRPDYVFHAAAYKHVPMMEDNPAQAVRNNINGTRIVADLAVKYGARKFVMISTDKAVNPTNVMGCSKRICEIYCQSLNKAIVEGKVKGVTQFVTTRFGNVLGSNGSVIPIFREQIRNGGPVTVTHPNIIRYFMLIPEACKLVLEAGTMGKGGEIFVFDMGKPVKIVDLAKRMILMSGAKDVRIEFSGLRDGEKLYEEVLSDKENTVPTVHPKIMVASVREYDYDLARANEERLIAASNSFDDMEIVRIMKEIVPEYKSQCSKYEVLDR